MTRARILADYVSSGDELALKAPIAGPTFTGTVGGLGTPVINLGSATGVLPVEVTGGTGLTSSIGDVVKVASAAFVTNQSISICDCFTSDYKFYKLFIGGFSTTVGIGTGYLQIGYLDSSDTHIDDEYYSRFLIDWNTSSTGITRWTGLSNPTTGASSWKQNNTVGFNVSNTWGSNITDGQTCEMFFYDPNNTGLQIVHWVSSSSETNYVAYASGYGTCDTSDAKHGLRLYSSSPGSTFRAQGHWAVYGYKI